MFFNQNLNKKLHIYVVSVLLASTVSIPLHAATYLPGGTNWEVAENRIWNTPTALFDDKTTQTLWVGSANGLEEHDRETGYLIRVYTQKDGLPDNRINALLSDDNGGFWVATDNGLAQRNESGEWRLFDTSNSGLPHNEVMVLESDGQQGIWLATPEGLAHRNNNAEWQVFNFDNTPMPSILIQDLLRAQDGTLWIATLNGLVHYDPIQDQWKTYTPSDGLPDLAISALVQDALGNIWAGTVWGGLARNDVQGNWQAVNTEYPQLMASRISDLTIDSMGTLWVATNQEGLLYRAVNGQWGQLTQLDSGWIGDPVLLSDRKELWIAANRRLAYLSELADLKVFKPKIEEQQATTTERLVAEDTSPLDIASLQDPETGVEWLLVNGKGLVQRTANGEETLVSDDYPYKYADKLFPGIQGGFWVWYYSRLYYRQADGTQKEYQLYDTKGETGASIEQAVSDGIGGLWLITNGIGGSDWSGGILFHLDPIHGEVASVLHENNGWSNNTLGKMVGHEQNLWLSSGSGLHYINNEGNWETYPQVNDQLSLGGNINALLPDKSGGLWLGTRNGGLVHWSPGGQWAVIDTGNSDIPSNQINDIKHAADGGLWLNTSNGLAHYSPTQDWSVINASNSALPSNRVDDFAVDNDGNLWIENNGQQGKLNFAPALSGVLAGSKAAILIHPKGQGGKRKLTTHRFIAASAYQALQERYYKHDDIYFISYRPDMDVNDDHEPDKRAVDAPVSFFQAETTALREVSSADIQEAFTWAGKRGKLSQPLLIHIVADSLQNGEILLDPKTGDSLTAEELGQLLDTYQQTTDTPVVVVLDSSYSGAFITRLSGSNRVIITSTDAEQNTAYQEFLGNDSFTWHYFQQLRRGHDFYSAFIQAQSLLERSGLRQQAQLDDNGDGMANSERDGRLAGLGCLNACFMPKPSQEVFNNGDVLRVTLPELPDDKDSYVGINLPENQGVFMLAGYNQLMPLASITEPPLWQGGTQMLDLPINSAFPHGDYLLYLLRVPKRSNPLLNTDNWELSVGTFSVE
ncbi:ligand-binding sensor domain-containing protein [Candidatus Venteria ishoeyi]|uniref:Two component regulator propeller n=1 Tax=Candidatus Venteria ishoeyi TaxID=1899563 RepID=A0A1H6FFQ2_9GAMM|nr:two-component regulator propeller domain-containing protein [Candidatus Venteria ishoeyi]SEH08908.1 Two component regulator propeller [Candidatus Venteria ishoeyi]